jgi:ABC-type multidrug transport system fused ATPase/permease subunit
MERVRGRQEWQFATALWRTAPGMAFIWWAAVVLRGVLPPLLAVASGTLISAVADGDPLAAPLTFVGVVFIVFQVLPALHQAVSANLGSRMSSWLNDELLASATEPEGMGHLEDPELINDLTMARDFDLGITGPPLTIAMDFIATGAVDMIAGVAAAGVLFAFEWWAPLVLIVGWGATHWMLRESGVWRDRNTDEVRDAQRHADYAYRLAVDAPAAKEMRLFGLGDWVVDRFSSRRRRLYELRWKATRLREKSVAGALLVVAAANVAVFWALADAAADGRISLASTVVFMQTAFGASMIAFGGLNWALDGVSAPVAAVLRLRETMAARGGLASGDKAADGLPTRDLRFRSVTFGYPTSAKPVLADFDLTIPAGTSMAIVGQNGAGKTTLAKLVCRLYDPQSGAIEVDGIDLRQLDIRSWRQRVTAVFQDFVRYELSLRDNVAPMGAPDDVILAALTDAGATEIVERLDGLDMILAKAYERGTDLSGGQWQRIALARTLCAVRQGAGLVLLDEPTAQLDVRGESEVFERVLAATRHVTTILVSHRFSTVRLADRICVVEGGRVVELGTHDELIEHAGRYATMFELQASRFSDEVEVDESGEEVAYESLA